MTAGRAERAIDVVGVSNGRPHGTAAPQASSRLPFFRSGNAGTGDGATADLARLAGGHAALCLLQATLQELDEATPVPTSDSTARTLRHIRSVDDTSSQEAYGIETHGTHFMRCRAIDPTGLPFSSVVHRMHALTTASELQAVPADKLGTFAGCLRGQRDALGKMAAELEANSATVIRSMLVPRLQRLVLNALMHLAHHAHVLQQHLVDALDVINARIHSETL
ncbi:hypothetical protein GCM10027214_32570 [Stenotrophomonas tumulicola]